MAYRISIARDNGQIETLRDFDWFRHGAFEAALKAAEANPDDEIILHDTKTCRRLATFNYGARS